MDDTDLDAAAKQTAQDFEDASNEEFKLFEKMPRITRNFTKQSFIDIEK